MVENSPELSLLLAQTQQALGEAQARIAELEARLTAAPAEPSPPTAPPLNLTQCYQRLLKQRGDHITLLDIDGRILYTNAPDTLLGYATADYQSLALATFLHTEDSAQVQGFLQTLQTHPNTLQRLEVCSCHQAGHKVWLEVTATNLLHDVEIRAIVLSCRDITAHKQTEEALQRHSERYRSIVEDQLDLVCRYNAAFELTYVNQAYAALFGKTPEALLGVNFFTLIAAPFHNEVRAKISALTAANPVVLTEELIRLPNGEIRWCQWVDHVLYDPAGNVLEYQAVGHDITAQKQLLQEQQRYTQAIEGTHQFLHSTLDAISANVAVLERDGTILNVNEYWRRFGLANGAQSAIGYCQENYLAICDAATGPQAEEAQVVADGIRAVIEGITEQFYLEYPCHSPITERWYGLRVTPFAEPPPRRVVVAHINITERVQAELAERKQRHFTEALLDSLAALTGALDVDQALQQILAATATVIPSDGGSIILFEANQCHIAYLRGYAPEAEAQLKAARFPLTWLVCGEETLQGRPYFVADTQTFADWTVFSASQQIRSSIGVPIQLHGQVIGLVCVDSTTPNYFQPDDAEKLQAFAHYASLALQNAAHVSQLETRVAERTAELQTAKEQVEAILDHSFDGILVVRPDLRIAQTNVAFNRIFASAPDDVFAGTLSDLIYLDDVARTQTIVQRVLATQVGEQIEMRCYHKDGTVFDAELSIGPIKGDGVVCTLRDITTRKQAEQALQASQRFSQKITDTVPNAIYIFDLQVQRNIYINQNMLSFLGYAVDIMQMQGMTFVEQIMHPEDQPLCAAHLQQVIQATDGQIFEFEYRMRHANGTWRWFLSYDTVFARDEAGRVQQILGVATDITARKQMEEALRASEARYRLLADNVTDWISCSKRDGEITYASPSIRTLGYAPEELLGFAAYSLVHPDDLPLIQQELSQLPAANAAALTRTYRIRHKAGHYLWMETHSHQIYSEETGEVIEFVASSRDITERKQAEATLRESEARYRLLADNITDMVARINESGEYTYVSPSCSPLLGYAPEELLGQSAYRFIHPDDLVHVQDLSTQAGQAQASSSTITCRILHKAGHYCWLEFASHLKWSATTGQLEEAIISARDVTARKQAEEATRESEARYRLLADNITDWIARVNAKMEFTYVLPSTRTLGYEPDELLGQQWFSLVHPDDLAALYATETEVVAQRLTTLHMIYRLRHKAGHYIWLETHGRIIYQAETNEIAEFIGVSSDISARKQAEDALRESETRYRLLADNITDVITQANLSGELLYVSPSIKLLLGYTAEEMLGKNVYHWLHPDDIARFQTTREDVHIPQTQLLTYRVRHKAGHYIWIEVQRALILNATGEISSIVATSRDITARKQTEVALAESEARYRLLAENVTDLIGCTNALGICTYISPSCRTLLGYEPEELIGQWTYHLIHPDDLPELQATHSLVLAKLASPPLLTYRMRHKAGHYVWLEMSSRNVCDPVTDEVIEFVNVAREVSERKRAEDTLRESEQKYRHLVEAMRGGLVILDTAQRVTYVNDRLCELLGYAREEMVGHLTADFGDAKNAAVLQAQFAKRAQGESSSYELVMQHKDGRPIHVLVSASPLRNEQQAIIGNVAVLLDIETQKRAEATLRENLRKEKELGELKSRFVSMASHEFRTPLASILAITETLLAYRHKLPEGQIDQRLRKIQEQIGYLKGIMEDVLQLARLQARRAEFNPVQSDLDALCRNVIEEFQNDPEQAKRLIYQGDPTLQPSLIDKKLMRQVINNLLSNGLKYSPADKPVTIKLTRAADQLIMTVQDQGMGIPEADLAHLFEPFHRAANVGTIAGTGLGMVITKESVELHGGTITVQSQLGVGTTVSVAIPCVTSDTNLT